MKMLIIYFIVYGKETTTKVWIWQQWYWDTTISKPEFLSLKDNSYKFILGALRGKIICVRTLKFASVEWSGEFI